MQYCYFIPGEQPILYVSDEHITLPAVKNEISRLVKIHPKLKMEKVSLGELREMLVPNQSDNKTPFSAEQQKVLGYFKKAAQMNASDIHLLIGKNNLTIVQFRIHGDLEEIAQLETQEGMTLASTIIQSMCDQTDPSFQPNRAQDGRVKQEFLKQVGLFGARYAHSPATFGLYVVMRILPDDSKAPPTLSELGYLPAQQRLVEQMLNTPEGIILLSGPTGSGKSTTLRSFNIIWQQLTHELKRMLTIEDPPEGEIYNAVQTAIIADKTDNEAVSQAWVRAISASLRQDPDALIVGELRDAQSAKAAIVAALTGHILLSTIHTNDAISILDRLIETFDASISLVADPQLMLGLLAQRLVQRLCSHCKLPMNEANISEQDKAFLAQYCDTDKAAFRNRQGCTHCYKGVVGRIAIAEVVRPDARLMELYRQGKKLAARSYWVHHLAGITFYHHQRHYINAGLIDPLDAHHISPLDRDALTLLSKEHIDVAV